MNWVKNLANILSKAVKYTALLVIIVETIHFFNDKLQAMSNDIKPE